MKWKMKTKIITCFFILIFSIQFISAGAVSDDYSIDSYHTGLAGQGAENTLYSLWFTSTYQQTTTPYAENPLYELGVGWNSDEEVEEEPEAGGQIVSSGGGGTTCTYDWVCSDWFECSESGIQERICINRGTCTGTIGMPNQTRNCTGVTEPIFDIFLIIPGQYKKVCAEQKIKAKITLINLGKIEVLDAFMTYWIINENNTLIAELKDTRRVKDEKTFYTEIKIPELTAEGIYRLYAQINYNNKTAIAGESFKIVSGTYCEVYTSISKYGYLILIAIMSFIIITLIILIIRKIKKKPKKKFRLFKRRKKKVLEKPVKPEIIDRKKPANISKVKKKKKKELTKK